MKEQKLPPTVGQLLNSVLPSRIEIVPGQIEIINCKSMSGVSGYLNKMPKELTLSKSVIDKNGGGRLEDDIKAKYYHEHYTSRLFQLLDNIDTFSDQVKPTDLEGYKKFYQLVMAESEKRFQFMKPIDGTAHLECV